MSFDVVDHRAFARQWAVQNSKIGWLLGAGASAAARVPTADHNHDGPAAEDVRRCTPAGPTETVAF